MSRILKVMVALLAIAAIAAPAMAEDRLSLSGQMEVRGYFTNTDLTLSAGGVSASADQSDAWNDQRMRIAGKLSVAEGVSVNFRFDSTESPENSSSRAAWGSNGQYTQRRADIQFDKAYLQIEKAGYTLQAGELYSGQFGIGTLNDALGAGFVVKRGPATIFHIKQSENTGGDVDGSLTGAKIDFKGEGFSVTPMAAYNANINDNGYNLLGLGAFAKADLGAVALEGEIDYFNGEDDVAPTSNDYKGLQVYLNGSTAVSETATVGAFVVYAQGEKTDTQVTRMAGTGFGGWDPLNYGYFSTDMPLAVNPFDPSGLGLGSMGISIYADVKASDDLSLKMSAGYVENEEDSASLTIDDLLDDGDMTLLTGGLDFSAYVLNGSVSYKLAPNTTLLAGVNYTSAEWESSVGGVNVSAELDEIQAATGLYVKF